MANPQRDLGAFQYRRHLTGITEIWSRSPASVLRNGLDDRLKSFLALQLCDSVYLASSVGWKGREAVV